MLSTLSYNYGKPGEGAAAMVGVVRKVRRGRGQSTAFEVGSTGARILRAGVNFPAKLILRVVPFARFTLSTGHSAFSITSRYAYF